MASGSEETRKALTGTSTVITNTTTRTITTSFVTVSIKGIGTGGTFLKVASGATVSNITQASDVLHSIPRGGVSTSNLRSQVLLRPASTTLITVIGAEGTLASNPGAR